MKEQFRKVFFDLYSSCLFQPFVTQVIVHKIESFCLSRKELLKFREGLGIASNLVICLWTCEPGIGGALFFSVAVWGRKEQNYAERGRGSKQFVNGNFKRRKLLKLIFHRYFFDKCVCEFDYEPTDEVILLQLKFLVKN